MAAALLPLFATSAGTAAAATAAGAAIGPVTAAASGAGTLAALPSLATTLTAAQAFSSIIGGSQEQGFYKAQAQQSELSARAEELKGRQQAVKIKDAMLSTMASQRAAFSARGLSPISGTFRTISADSANQASRDIDIAQFGSAYAAATERAQAKQYKMQGKSALTKGFIGAAGSLRSLIQ